MLKTGERSWMNSANQSADIPGIPSILSYSPTLMLACPWLTQWMHQADRSVSVSVWVAKMPSQSQGPKDFSMLGLDRAPPKLPTEKWSSMNHYGYSELDWVSKLLCPLSLIYLPSMVIIYSSNFGIKVFSANKFDDHDDNEDDKVWRWRWSERRGKECLCCIGIGRKSFGAPGEPAPLPQWAR